MQTRVYQYKESSRDKGSSGNRGQTCLRDNRSSTVIQQKLALAIQQKAENTKTLQAKFIIQRTENQTGMPNRLKSGIEQLSGFDMSDVRVHYNSFKPASVHAHAYAQGTNIYMAPGQQKHLPHEAWHVVQQKQGRVQSTAIIAGMSVNNNPGLETEADRMGAKASIM